MVLLCAISPCPAFDLNLIEFYVKLVQVGVLIGKSGDTIRYLQYNSGAKIQIMRDADTDPHAATRPVELIGTLENINKAEKLIKDVIAEVCGWSYDHFLLSSSQLLWFTMLAL